MGHKDAWNKKNGLGMSLWYPMDRDEYDRTISESGRNTYWLRYGYESRVGLSRISPDHESDKSPCPWIFKFLDDVKMDTV